MIHRSSCQQCVCECECECVKNLLQLPFCYSTPYLTNPTTYVLYTMDTTTTTNEPPSFHPEDRRLSIHKLTHSSSLPSFESLSPTMHNARPAPAHHPIPNVLRPTPLDHRPDLTGRNTRWRRDSLPSIANLDFPPSTPPPPTSATTAASSSTSSASVATEPQPFPSNLRRHSTPDNHHHHHEHLFRSQHIESPYSRTPELRESHKLAERRRRKEMKELFDDLLNVLPIDKGIKTSKWEILSKGKRQHVNRQGITGLAKFSFVSSIHCSRRLYQRSAKERRNVYAWKGIAASG